MRKIIIMIMVFGLAMSSWLLAQATIEEQLQQKMAQDSNEKIPILIFYEGTPSFSDIANEYRFLGSEEVIREQVIRVMKENAESMHYWLKQICESPAMVHEVEGFTSIWIANAVALKATPNAIREIARQPNVVSIVSNEPVPMLFESRGMTWGVEKINAPAVWSQNITGLGVTVAVIDTGVNAHKDLEGRVKDGKNYITPGTAPRDDHGHGTHCAGTVAGNGTMGTQTGVAPKATIVAIKVLGANGSGSWSNLYLAIEEAVQCNPKPKVLSMSLGGFPNNDIRDRLRSSCGIAIQAGLIPVIAAGNSGNSGIGSPGDVPEVITIGATDSNDRIAYFSSIGPTKPWNGQTFVKPDVTAPGVSVVSCSHNSNGYTTMSGTSMATPHVAGVVALMCQAKPSLDTVKAKACLENTATDLGSPGKDNTYGSGRVNADKAVKAAQSLTSVGRDDRFEMVVKELSFETMVDANGNLEITKSIENDALPATVTVWVNVREPEGRKGIYYVSFTLIGPNGTKTGTARVDYDNIPTDPNKYDARYGFNVGNFTMVTGLYTGTVKSIEPNAKVRNLKITLDGKSTWPARPAN